MSSERQRILVVDDEPNMRRILQALLERSGYLVETASDGEAAKERLIDGGFDLMMSDIRMPKCDGLELLGWTQSHRPELPVILITAHGTIDSAVLSMKAGAFDFVTKPFDNTQLLRTAEKALRQGARDREGIHAGSGRAAYRIIGTSEASIKIREWILKVADLPTNILLNGETGTGHEVVGQAIHEASARADQPFVKISCGAIPKDWVDSELFGHEEGALPGAASARPGRFELASGGTLLLDEIADLGLEAQGRVQEALAAGAITRVGAFNSRSVDIRLIATTKKDLAAEVEAGRFNADLFYSLSVAPYNLVPLRERLADLPAHAEYYIALFNTRLGRQVSNLSGDALARLMAHRWPGNVRELENVIERAMLFADGDVLEVGHLPDHLGSDTDERITDFESGMKGIVRRATAGIERELIRRALDDNEQNITHAAKQLGISRKSLQTKMRDLGLRESDA
jgi:two-component system, NtrC family, response regulator AtoC